MISKYIIPLILLALFIYASVKKIPLYDTFVCGAKNATELCFSLFPYIACIFILVELFYASNLSEYLKTLLSPMFEFLNIPTEIFELLLFRPFSGSGSMAILENIFVTYGADSRISRISAIIASSSETVFYLSALYFSSQGIRKLRGAIAISLISTAIGVWLTCIIIH